MRGRGRDEGGAIADGRDIAAAYREIAPRYDADSARYARWMGYHEADYRREAIEALALQPGDTVIDIGCGTGLNHAALHEAVGESGRIIGLDVTPEMLARARERAEARGWSNVELVSGDARTYAFDRPVDAVLATYSLSFVPECGEVVRAAAAALRPRGRMAIADQKVPALAPWLGIRLFVAATASFGITMAMMSRRPWVATREAMEQTLRDVRWRERYLGFGFVASGVRPGSPPSTDPDHPEPRQGS